MTSRHQYGQTDTTIASIPLVCIYYRKKALHTFFSDHFGQKYSHKQSLKLAKQSCKRYFVISNSYCIWIFFARKRRQKQYPRYTSRPGILSNTQKKNWGQGRNKNYFFELHSLKIMSRGCFKKKYFGHWELRIAKMGNIFAFSKTWSSEYSTKAEDHVFRFLILSFSMQILNSQWAWVIGQIELARKKCKKNFKNLNN